MKAYTVRVAANINTSARGQILSNLFWWWLCGTSLSKRVSVLPSNYWTGYWNGILREVAWTNSNFGRICDEFGHSVLIQNSNSANFMLICGIRIHRVLANTRRLRVLRIGGEFGVSKLKTQNLCDWEPKMDGTWNASTAVIRKLVAFEPSRVVFVLAVLLRRREPMEAVWPDLARPSSGDRARWWHHSSSQGCSNNWFGEFELSKRQKIDSTSIRANSNSNCHFAIRFARIYLARVRSSIIRGRVRTLGSYS
jgi:hypothetical protein